MRNRLLVAAVVGVGASALLMACGGDDEYVAPPEEDSGASADATSPGPDAGMGMVVDAGAEPDATTGDATAGNDASTADSAPQADASASDASDAAPATDAADASDAADAADTSDAADAADAQDAADAADASDAADAGKFLAPKCDGTISVGEYGPGIAGKDEYLSGTQLWHMTWDDTNLYLALEVADVTQPVLLYFDTVTGGLTIPSNYDGIAPSSLGLSADLLVYEKTGYNATRTVAGAAWSAPVENKLTVCDNNGTGSTREIVLPWALSVAARPATFQFFGMAENGNTTAYIFGQMPVDNPSTDQHDTDPIVDWFTVSNTTPAGAGSAFATITKAP